jgi:excisionase family DNA binding protein
MSADRWYSAGEAADKLGVSLETVRRYMDTGDLTGYVLPSGHRRIDPASIDRLKTTSGQDEK